MIEVLQNKYWSKADAFLLPLTGLKKSSRYKVRSYLFWEDYNIEDYKLIVTYSHDNLDDFSAYCKEYIFPILDKNGYLLESYDCEGMTVFVLDISEWAMDIEMFLKGKYSKLSGEAKMAVEKYHEFFQNGERSMPVHILISLFPNGRPKDTSEKKPGVVKVDKEKEFFEKMTPIEYVAKYYGLDLVELRKVGELGDIYDITNETLTVDCNHVMS